MLNVDSGYLIPECLYPAQITIVKGSIKQFNIRWELLIN